MHASQSQLARFLLTAAQLFFISAASITSAFAQAPKATDAAQNEMLAALSAARGKAVTGPAEVTLRDQAKLKLPEEYMFIPENEARALLRAMGNPVGNSVMGIVYPPKNADAGWMMVASYNPSGYVKDDDAKDWKANELLKTIREGTEEGNKERRSRGFPEMDIIGWIEKPTYEAATHRLVWSIASRDKGAAANAEQGVNYNTYALGREGYISLNLVTDASTIEKEKPVARTMLAALEFNSGKRYSDFNASTDRVAEYGLAALVAGAAAKKLGAFAVIGAFLLKFSKVLIIGGLAALGVLGKFFMGRKSD